MQFVKNVTLNSFQRSSNMAIENNICIQCNHDTICKIQDKIVVFDDDAKKPLGVDIEIKNCTNFEEAK